MWCHPANAAVSVELCSCRYSEDDDQYADSDIRVFKQKGNELSRGDGRGRFFEVRKVIDETWELRWTAENDKWPMMPDKNRKNNYGNAKGEKAKVDMNQNICEKRNENNTNSRSVRRWVTWKPTLDNPMGSERREGFPTMPSSVSRIFFNIGFSFGYG